MQLLNRPDLLVVVVLGDDSDFVSDEVGRVEADTELADHRQISAGLDRLHEGLGARLGDRAQVVDQIVLCHADTRVLDGQRLGLLVRDQLNLQLLLRLELVLVRQR